MVGCVGWLGGFYSVYFSLHLDKPDNLAGLPNYLKILKTLEEQGEVEGDDGKEVYHIHRRPDELQLARTAGDSHEVLNGEEADGEVVDDPDDLEEEGELNHPMLVRLQLVDGGNDEGDSGDEHHRQREEGAKPFHEKVLQVQ